MEAERLTVGQVIVGAQIQENTIRSMLRGTANRGGQKYFEPSARAFAWIAEFFNLEIGYVMSKAGFGIDAARWNNFDRVERQTLLAALRQLQLDEVLMNRLDPKLSNMLRELESTVIEQQTITEGVS